MSNLTANKNGNGLTVIMTIDNKKRILNNVTEIHYGFKEYHPVYENRGIAFESEIHCTGFTADFARITEMEIVEADSIKNDFENYE
jgi:hypothetical protein